MILGRLHSVINLPSFSVLLTSENFRKDQSWSNRLVNLHAYSIRIFSIDESGKVMTAGMFIVDGVVCIVLEGLRRLKICLLVPMLLWQ